MTEIETLSLQTQQNKVKVLFGPGRTSWRSRASHMCSYCSPSPIPKSLRVPCPIGKHVKGMLKLASASVGGQVVLASSNDDRNPPENIVDG